LLHAPVAFGARALSWILDPVLGENIKQTAKKSKKGRFIMAAIAKVLVFLGVVVFCLMFSPSTGSRIQLNALAPNATGACNNSQDLRIFNQTNSTFHALVQKCAANCVGGGECSTTCIAKDIGLTPGCARCFGNDVQCTAEHCTIPCLEPNSKECVECSLKNCQDALLQCAGVNTGVIPS